jgi:DNA ligase-3
LEITKGDVRLAKIAPNPFGGDGDMKQYYHIKCLFETFKRARKTTRKIESADDIEDFQSVTEADKKLIVSCIEARGSDGSNVISDKSSSKSATKKKQVDVKTDTESSSDDEKDTSKKSNLTIDDDSDDGLSLKDVDCDDNKFGTFQKIVEEIKNESGHLKKTAILKNFFKDGINKSKLNL